MPSSCSAIRLGDVLDDVDSGLATRPEVSPACHSMYCRMAMHPATPFPLIPVPLGPEYDGKAGRDMPWAFC